MDVTKKEKAARRESGGLSVRRCRFGSVGPRSAHPRAARILPPAWIALACGFDLVQTAGRERLVSAAQQAQNATDLLNPEAGQGWLGLFRA
jgi:hypothetical protein